MTAAARRTAVAFAMPRVAARPIVVLGCTGEKTRQAFGIEARAALEAGDATCGPPSPAYI
jgi:hypothetical protein